MTAILLGLLSYVSCSTHKPSDLWSARWSGPFLTFSLHHMTSRTCTMYQALLPFPSLTLNTWESLGTRLEITCTVHVLRKGDHKWEFDSWHTCIIFLFLFLPIIGLYKTGTSTASRWGSGHVPFMALNMYTYSVHAAFTNWVPSLSLSLSSLLFL